ncbi:hypothetical protein SLA2020_366390 [Shorea laevis]
MGIVGNLEGMLESAVLAELLEQRMGLRTKLPSATYLSNVSVTLPPVAPRADSLRYSRSPFLLVAVSAAAVLSRLIMISQCPAEIGRLGFVLARLISLCLSLNP